MADKFISMDQIPLKSNGRIVAINIDKAFKKKLTDMGLVQGTEFRVDGRAPLGDPIKINLRGYNLTIRKSDARNITVEQL